MGLSRFATVTSGLILRSSLGPRRRVVKRTDKWLRRSGIEPARFRQ